MHVPDSLNITKLTHGGVAVTPEKDNVFILELNTWLNVTSVMLVLFAYLAFSVIYKKKTLGFANSDGKEFGKPRDDTEVPQTPAPSELLALVPGTAPPLLKGNQRFRVLIMLAMMVQAGYLSFRLCTFTHTIASIIFFICYEVPFNCYALCGCIGRWTCHDTKASAPDLNNILPWMPPGALPEISVLVPTYDESEEILEETLRSCCAMDYPQERLHVYLLDDGKRAFARQLVERLQGELRGSWRTQLVYAARDKIPGQPHHAKAGNLNYALNDIRVPGDFVVVFDADMAPQPEFLQRTLPLFYKWDAHTGALVPDDGLAYVQTPQAFHNTPRWDFLDNSQCVWYFSVCPALDSFGGQPFCGTNTVLRRHCLIELPNGGLPYGSLTEDLHGSVQLLKSGYRSRYLNERLAYGLAPMNLSEAMKQRTRWAIGALQMISAEKLWFNANTDLNFMQRFTLWGLGGCCYLAIGFLIMLTLAFLSIFLQNDQLDLLPTPLPGGFEIVGIICAMCSYGMQVVMVFNPPGGVPLVYCWRMMTSFITYLPCALQAMYVVARGVPFSFGCTSKEQGDDWDGWICKQNYIHLSLLSTIVCGLIFVYFQIIEEYGETGSAMHTILRNDMSLFWLISTLITVADVTVTMCWPLPKQRRSGLAFPRPSVAGVKVPEVKVPQVMAGMTPGEEIPLLTRLPTGELPSISINSTRRGQASP